ncbi:MAG: bifunctional uroporphyrinogen-III C-methyltransferase/uroporphyrinogen-III synthase, partial [Actinomycetota bacterium]|nr:bifunctional uroporphyrinogen-III C-methyltransferase/uroporphyrinogen-III synthase [Actinomycetota bacterium]
MTTRRTRSASGSVALVGAGAGDPGLLTVRAAEVLGDADLVLADADVPDEVLRHVGADAEVVRVEPGEAVAPRLVAAAKEGARAVRLVAGDPLGSASGVRDAEAVLKGRQRLEVVPGVPAAVAAPAYAGLPLGLPHTVAGGGDADWRALAAAPGSLVLTLPVAEVPKAASALVEHGRRADTPVTVTVGGTTVAQRTVVTTLDAVETDLAAAALAGDAVVVVGEAARRGARMGWYESRALYGWKVLVPRTRDQAGALSQQLRAHGALPVEVPTIAVEPPRTPAPMERAVKGLVTGRYLWVAFTSTNAVRAVREKLEEFGLDARAFAGVKVAAVGDA